MQVARYNSESKDIDIVEDNVLGLDEVIFVGDDYGLGGNDESVYRSEINFVTIDDYRTFPEVMKKSGLL